MSALSIRVDWSLRLDGKPQVLIVVESDDLPRISGSIDLVRAQTLIEDLMRAKADALFAATLNGGVR